MFLRVETSLKSDFVDPIAQQWLTKIGKVHGSLAEKIRWARRLPVYWIELDAPRDRVVQAVQAAFRDPVLNWLFTGDLLPSAAGPSGTLQDLMQAAPSRPGVFHGIEKRKRLNVYDEQSQVALDLLQSIMGYRSPKDKLITGELLILEGPKIIQSDLEWIARYLYTDEQFESWSFISEDELKRNSRFQAEQVQKYLVPNQPEVAAKWLQFRKSSSNPVVSKINWSDLEKQFLTESKKFQSLQKAGSDDRGQTNTSLIQEEWVLHPKIQLGSLALNRNTFAEAENSLLKSQLEVNAELATPRLQTTLSVLPKKNRLWMGTSMVGTDAEFHPERIISEYHSALKNISESTSTPLVQMKSFEDDLENNPSFFWVSTVATSSVPDATLVENKNSTIQKQFELIWVGQEEPLIFNSALFVEKLKDARFQAEQARALEWVMSGSGKTLPEALKSFPHFAQSGLDLVLDGATAWFSQVLLQPMSLGQWWWVPSVHLEWVKSLLSFRALPFRHLGTVSNSGYLRIIEQGTVRFEVHVNEFFYNRPDSVSNHGSWVSEKKLMSEPCFLQDPLKTSAQGFRRYSAEELLIKSNPFVLKPKSSSWLGVMVLVDLFDVGMKTEDLEWMLRRCTAVGGCVTSIQVSMVNGLKYWSKSIRSLCDDFGIRLNQYELREEPSLRGHWCAIQLIANVTDIRNVRSEDAKAQHDRIYWLDGAFDQPAFRWLAGMEGRYQTGLSSSMAVDPRGIKESLVNMLVQRRFGADVTLLETDLQFYATGYLVTLSESERFAVEEEWRTLELKHEFLGKTATTPYLILKNGNAPVVTISIEDASVLVPNSMGTKGDS
jgi:hypothetical protein